MRDGEGSTAARWDVPFAIQDYDGATTFLLSPPAISAETAPTEKTRAIAADVVIGALITRHFFDVADVLERLPADPVGDLEAPVDRLERRLIAVADHGPDEGDGERSTPEAVRRVLRLWVKVGDAAALAMFAGAVAASPTETEIAGVGVRVEDNASELAQRLSTQIWSLGDGGRASVDQFVRSACAEAVVATRAAGATSAKGAVRRAR